MIWNYKIQLVSIIEIRKNSIEHQCFALLIKELDALHLTTF